MIVTVDHITKTYPVKQGGKKSLYCALNEISFGVPQGELFGIIGPDGAGKTTLFRILATLLEPDKGRAEVAGWDTVKDYKQIRQRVGYMPGRFSLYQDLTVEENLSFFATVFNTSIEENRKLIQDIYVQIEPFRKRRAGALSGGMKQKLALCCALIHRPELLLLDEPTTGVDPVSRREFWEMLKKLRNEGITVLVSTPYMDEAGLCERIALMQQGKMLKIDTPLNIVAGYTRQLYSVKSDNMFGLLKTIRGYDFVESCFAFGETLHVTCGTGQTDFEKLLRKALSEDGHEEVEILSIQPGIEDCFMELSTVREGK